MILGLADHRAVYNLQSDDGLVYFTAIGDIVKVQIDFRKDPKERIAFIVNGNVVGVTGWNFEQAHFALSVDANGEAEFDVKFETDYDAGT